MNIGTKIFVVIISLAVAIFLGYKIGLVEGQENVLKTPPDSIINTGEEEIDKADFSVFWEAWRNLERDFLDKERLIPQEMVYGAIGGMVDSLGDQHTNFFNPEEAREFEQGLSGEYQGVGMFVSIKKDQLTVISPLEGTPAQKAGLRAGDKIIEVGDKETQGMFLDEAVSLIKGPEGTDVRLLINRQGWSEPKEFIIKRALIIIPTLEWEIIGENKDIAWLRIYHFNRILTPQLEKKSIDILNSSAKKIILDLRNNPGGYLDVANQVAGWFLEQGQVIVIQESNIEEERKTFKSNGPSTFSEYPIVVLINEGSASGSEILAGALRDNRGAQLIGETSFGKGSVQKPIFLSDGSSLKITIARWLTPNGESISETGLLPDIVVELTEEDWQNDLDPQLDKAVEVLNKIIP